MQGRFGVVLLGFLALVVFWFSNQKEVAFTGRSQFNIIGLDQAVRLGAEAYEQILAQEARQGHRVVCAGNSACDSEARYMTETVRSIGQRLEQAASELEADLISRGAKFSPVTDKFDWTYHLVDNPTPNAFCLPGGYVAVYTGLLDITGNNDGRVNAEDLRDVSKLAIVMGHEIAHALAHHGAERMSQRRLTQMGAMAVGLGLGEMSMAQRRNMMQAFGLAAQGGLMAFSREHETEADRIGLELLVRACFDPRQAPELWQRMGQISGTRRPPEWMSTHPASQTRARNFQRWMPQALSDYERNCGRLP